ncbi:MAG: hypothetical protein CSYNP_01285 [Syntrophus sp. SKADARSKE-3]|nr:hypothetical protein [Syntrophus sp. SKADARSKE-3]
MIKHSFTIFISFLILSFAAYGAAENKIINIRHWSAPDHTRVVIDTTEDPVYEVDKDDKKISLEISDAVYAKSTHRLISLRKPGIDRIVVTPRQENRVVIELFLTEHTDAKIFKLDKIEDKPYRIVVDVVLPEVEKKESEEREKTKVALKKKIVVIDPGHGGDDPGAVGRLKTYEKNVVLAISRKIRDVLNKKKGYRAFLTRDGDYYVPFKKRLKIAREYHADLFISIHADAERTRQAAGASVYSLSVKSASSEAARILARNENLADIVGGVANGEVIKDESDPIILNMFQTATMNTSRTFGYMLLRNMSAIHRIKFANVQEAPFMVLKLPEVPSVLIETAFISNPREEKLLRSPKFQKELAGTIADSAVEFLEHGTGEAPPAPVTVTKAESSQSGKETVTNSKAEPRHIQANTEQKTVPRPVPAVSTASKKKPVLVIYVVKKGDSLERIARKYGVNVADLAELNDVNLNKPLYVKRKLKIPVPVEDEDEAPVDETVADRKGAAAEKGARKEGQKKELVKKEVVSEQKQESGSIKTSTKTSNKKTAVVTYTVKKGDSLDRIAKKYGVAVADLAELNDVKLKKPLYVNRKLKIPVPAEEESEAAPINEAMAEKKTGLPEKTGKKEGVKKELVKKEGEELAYSTYIVKKGESLAIIAGKCKTTLAVLLKLNEMKLKDPLYAGKKIKIPANTQPKENGKKLTRRTYIVKKGDTLDVIARKHKTTVAVLMKMNESKKLTPLYVDQKLDIPAHESSGKRNSP